MVIDRLVEHNLTTSTTSLSQLPGRDIFSTIHQSARSFDSLFAYTATKSSEYSSMYDTRPDYQYAHSETTGGRNKLDAIYTDPPYTDQSLVDTESELEVIDDQVATHTHDTAEEMVGANHHDNFDENIEKSPAGKKQLRYTEQKTEKVTKEGDASNVAHAAVSADHSYHKSVSVTDAQIIAHDKDSSDSMKQEELLIKDSSAGGGSKLKMLNVSALELPVGVRSLRNADQTGDHTVVAKAQVRGNGENIITSSDIDRVIVNNNHSAKENDAHTSGHSNQQQRGSAFPTDESVRIAFINRNNDGQQQYTADIREMQLRHEGATKTLQDFRQFLQREISPSIVKHARFVFHNDQESEMRILLKPAELGVMRVKLFMQNNTIHGKILVDSVFTKDIVENSLADLHKTLRETGLHSGGIDVALNSNNQPNNDHQHSFSPIRKAGLYEQPVIAQQEVENNLSLSNSMLINLYV